MRIPLRWLLPAGALIAAAALVLAWMNASGRGAALSASSSTQPAVRSACPPAKPGHFTCLTIIHTGASPRAASPDAVPDAARPYTPAQIRSAYGLTSATAGAGRTVAIVDAYDDPRAESDLGVFRRHFGLPACTTKNGCFRKVNQAGRASPRPAADADWSIEISVDLDMVSATCPVCHILLVEAGSDYNKNLAIGVSTAAALGARYVSNSYGGPEYKGEATYYDPYYHHRGVAVTVAAGDTGYGVQYPAASPYVTAVGGTSLKPANNRRHWTETAWGDPGLVPPQGTGSGCSRYSFKPSWQPRMSGCPTRRTVDDVSAVADPNPGVLTYDTVADPGVASYGWNAVGGTSVAAPIIAAVYARSGVPAAGTYPANYPYKHTGSLWDVIGGRNGTCAYTYLCTAVKGFDGPTGLGSPDSSAAFKN